MTRFGPMADPSPPFQLCPGDLDYPPDDRILLDAGTLLPPQLRSLDAIHITAMRQLGGSLRRVVTYDSRMVEAASAMGGPQSRPPDWPAERVRPSVNRKCRRQTPKDWAMRL